MLAAAAVACGKSALGPGNDRATFTLTNNSSWGYVVYLIDTTVSPAVYFDSALVFKASTQCRTVTLPRSPIATRILVASGSVSAYATYGAGVLNVMQDLT